MRACRYINDSMVPQISRDRWISDRHRLVMTSASNQSPRHSASFYYYQIQGVHSFRHIQRRGYTVRATKGTVVGEIKTNNVLANYSTGRNRGVRIYRYYVLSSFYHCDSQQCVNE
jgi:hypothetical protein